VLQKQQSIREIHLVSHGSPDCLYLGNSRLSLETLPRYTALLGQWREAIAQGANILLYGCQVAAEGLGLMNALHTLTGASIAAASQPVGKGNWRLDRQIGAIAASLAFSPELQRRYAGTFGTGYALSNNTLIAFDTSNPSNPAPAIAIAGLGPGETLVGIDVRPQNGLLYGLTSNGAGGIRLYVISPRTGVATPLTDAPVQFSDGSTNLPIAGTNFGFDFNPTVDRIRIVTDAGVNLRLNPNTGLIIDGNTAAPGIQPDGAISGGTTTVDATAYTNSVPNATVTTQYTLDAASDTLFIQNPPNNGVQINPLAITLNGARLDFTSVNGFDIPASVQVTTANAPATGEAIAALTVGGTTGLYSINLGTGAATLLGNVGDGSTGLVGLTVASAQIPVNQTLQGGNGRDLLSSGDGDDMLVGRGGRDRLLGFGGNDTLIGGKGSDTLTGGAGADRFVCSGRTQQAAFSQSTLANLDRIRDFNAVEGDRIQLDFDNNLTTPNLPRKLFNAGVQTGRSLQAAAESAYLDKNQARRGNQRLLANQAVFFEGATAPICRSTMPRQVSLPAAIC
jgi:Ca2+-binding RTX toxin-like protein